MKNTWKRGISLLLVFSMLLPVMAGLTGCQPKTPPEKSAEESSEALSAAESWKDAPRHDVGKNVPLSPATYGTEAEYDAGNTWTMDSDLVLEKDGVSVRVIDSDLSYAKVDVAKVDPPKAIEGAEVTAYDINLETYEPTSGMYEIRLPYSHYDLKGEPAKGTIGAAYYNPETGETEPVAFTLDESAKEVVISTSHFSVYYTLNIVNRNTAKAYADYTVGSDDFQSDVTGLDTKTAFKIIEETPKSWYSKAFSWANTAVGWADTGAGYFGKLATWVAPIDNYMHACVTQNLQLLPAIGKINEKYGNAMLGLSAVKLSLDTINAFVSGDELTFEKRKEYAYSAYNTVASAGISLIPAAPLAGVILLAAPLASDSFKDIRDTVIDKDAERYYRAYRDFYKNSRYKRNTSDWADVIDGLRKRQYADPDEFVKVIEKEVHDYVRLPWTDIDPKKPIEDHLDWYVSVQEGQKKGNVGDVSGMAQIIPTSIQKETREKLSKNHEAFLLRKTIPDAIRQLAKRDLALHQQYVQDQIDKLNREMNMPLELGFEDKMLERDPSAKSEFAGALAVMADKDGKPMDGWEYTLDEEGSGRFTFTRVAWLDANLPSKTLYYKKGKDPKKDAPDEEKTFNLGSAGFQWIALNNFGLYPTLADILERQPEGGIPGCVCTEQDRPEPPSSSPHDLFGTALKMQMTDNDPEVDMYPDMTGVSATMRLFKTEGDEAKYGSVGVEIQYARSLEPIRLYGEYDEYTGDFRAFHTPEDNGLKPIFGGNLMFEYGLFEVHFENLTTMIKDKKGRMVPEITIGGELEQHHRNPNTNHGLYIMMSEVNGSF